MNRFFQIYFINILIDFFILLLTGQITTTLTFDQISKRLFVDSLILTISIFISEKIINGSEAPISYNSVLPSSLELPEEVSPDIKKAVVALVRQTARWGTAAAQDQNPFIANLHANYGAAYMYAVRGIASDQQIQRITGVDPLQLEYEITRIQDNSFKKLALVCPEGKPRTEFLASIGEIVREEEVDFIR